jgi:hypothetical protein
MSGNGYFQGEFTGLEHSVKDSKRFPKEAKGWAYFSFGHKYPLAKQAPLRPIASCAECHVAKQVTWSSRSITPFSARQSGSRLPAWDLNRTSNI